MSAALSAWRARLATMSSCPWPGARPITIEKDGIDSLHLRGHDVRSIIRKIEDSDIVVLTGESGVGKSSLLSVGVVPQLERRGYLVVPCSDWSSSSSRADEVSWGRSLMHAALRRKLPYDVHPNTEHEDLLRELDDRFPGRVVIVLDQFEELIRYEPGAAREVLGWVEDVIASSSARVLLSLRAEYGFQVLGGIRVGAGRLEHLQVGALSGDDIALAIATCGASNDHKAIVSLPAVEAITSAWSLADKYEVGLLHLQALMWSLWMTKKGDRIELADVVTLFPGTIDATGATRSFVRALAVSVQISLDQCRDAAEHAPDSAGRVVNAVLQSRAAGSIAGMIPHLSNDGYKVNREREQLALLALFGADSDEWTEALARAADGVSRLRSRVDASTDDDWLSTDRYELLPRSTLVWPWDLDPQEQTSGPLLGTRPEDAVFESFRAYYFGLEWLLACSMIRISRTARSRVMVSLVHDGFAEGLNLWRRDRRLGLSELTTRIVATRGHRFLWPPRPSKNHAEFAIHSNLRIQHSEITGRILDTTFLNCDFRGTLFQDCAFEGVTFVNCILDDVQFSRCPIIGVPTRFVARSGDVDSDSLPGYLVPATAPHVQSISWYRGLSSGALELYSATAGLPALPVESHDDAVGATAIPTQGSGLAFLGGRISSLKFRHCEFFNDAWILMSEAAGTSVEFSDQDQLRLECDAVTLRAVTFTTPLEPLEPLPLPPTKSARRPNREVKRFELNFNDALLSNIWFSQGMHGRVAFVNCLVWQLFNASDHGLEIRFSDDSGFVGLVNVAGARESLDAPSVAGLGNAANRVDFARSRIDYRAHPTAEEVQQLKATIGRISPSFFRSQLHGDPPSAS